MTTVRKTPLRSRPVAVRPSRRLKLSYDDYRLLSTEKRYELIDGEMIMPPAPNIEHQRSSTKLIRLLANFVEHNKRGQVFAAPTDVVFTEHDTLQPDLIFVSAERAAIITKANIQGAPDWVAEIVSPGSEQRDYEARKHVFARFGVAEYWVVDPAARSVEVHVQTDDGDYVLKQRAVGKGRVRSAVIPGFAVSLREVFQS